MQEKMGLISVVRSFARPMPDGELKNWAKKAIYQKKSVRRLKQGAPAWLGLTWNFQLKLITSNQIFLGFHLRFF